MISSNKVNKLYGGFHALVDVTGHVSKGEVIVICGPSGSGKSTLIRTLNRLEEIPSGSIAINGQDIHEKGLDVNRFRSHIGFVFQQFNLFPHLTALQNCMLAPTRLTKMPWKADRSEARRVGTEWVSTG